MDSAATYLFLFSTILSRARSDDPAIVTAPFHYHDDLTEERPDVHREENLLSGKCTRSFLYVATSIHGTARRSQQTTVPRHDNHSIAVPRNYSLDSTSKPIVPGIDLRQSAYGRRLQTVEIAK